MSTASTLNIRGAKLYEVTSTSDTATSTQVAAVMTVDGLPQGSNVVRNATALTDTSAVTLPGRLKSYGTFSYVVYATAAGVTSVLGTSKILRLDIPADKDGTATTHEILRVWMSGNYSEDALQPGGDTDEVTIKRSFSLTGALVTGTATASII